MAMHLGRLPWEFEVLEPPELLEVMREMVRRLRRAAGAR
jgi:hypothetical protein